MVGKVPFGNNRIPTGVRRNVAWSFYSLNRDATFHIEKDFESEWLRHPFVYCLSTMENEWMDTLLDANMPTLSDK